ncbi:MAG: DoxX family protein [Variovorax sp.]|nr:DoxX family protein [Variovorax sp.]
MQATLHAALTSPWLYWLAMLCLCAAYLQGGFDKARDFAGAVAEVKELGLAPAAPIAAATIVLQVGASALVLTGWYRWLGALALAGFTVLAGFLADRFWRGPKSQRLHKANAFFEHWGLVGGLLLIAWIDLGGSHGG